MGSGNDEHPPRNAEWHRGLDTRLLHGAEPPAAESVEQYLWLHEHIERLRDDKRPTPAGELAPEEVRAYQIAALLRAAALEQLSMCLSRQGVSSVGEPGDRVSGGDRVKRHPHRLP
jgi:hypothetical protein